MAVNLLTTRFQRQALPWQRTVIMTVALIQTNAAVQNVDYNGFPDTAPGGGEAWNYRPHDTGVGQEITGDFLRDKFINDFGVAQDYDMGYWNGGFWENYTRTFPTNNYNVYSRHGRRGWSLQQHHLVIGDLRQRHDDSNNPGFRFICRCKRSRLGDMALGAHAGRRRQPCDYFTGRASNGAG